jgi:hypothetical protein
MIDLIKSLRTLLGGCEFSAFAWDNDFVFNYSSIFETTPAPTVRPPSLIANRIPFSIAIG